MSRGALLVALAALAAFVAGVLFHARYAFDGLAAFDVGILLEGAERTRRGELFGADFIAPYGPLRYWLVAACFSLFGASLGHWCWIAVVLQSAAGAGLFALGWRRASFLGGALALVLISVAHGSFHKCFLAVAAVAGMGLAAVVLPRRGRVSPGRLGAAGVGVGLIFLTRYDAGAFVGVAIAAGALLRPGDRLRVPGLVAAGAALLVLPVGALLWASGADGVEWIELTRQRVAVQELLPARFPGPDEWHRPGRRMLGCSLILAPVVHLLNLVRAIRLRKEGEDASFEVAVAVFGLLLLNQARLLPTANHLFQALPPTFLGLAQLCAGRRQLWAWPRRGLMVGATLCILHWVHHANDPHPDGSGRRGWGVYPAVYSLKLEDPVWWRDPRAGIRLSRLELAAYRGMVSAIQEVVPEAEALATGPRSSIFCFLADRRPATPYSEPSYYYRNEDRQRLVARAWELERAPAVVFAHQESAGYLRFDRDARFLYLVAQRDFGSFERHGPYELRRKRDR